MHSASSSPVRLKIASTHWLVIVTSLLRHCIYMFLLQLFFCWCLISRLAGMCILHKSHHGRVSFPFCTTAIREKKCLNMNKR